MTETDDRPLSEGKSYDWPAFPLDRYRSYEVDDGSYVVYDGENDEAWVRSDTTVEPER